MRVDTLIDFIMYDGKHLDELTDKDQGQQIIELAKKLRPLEAAILDDELGSITIMPSGGLIIDRFKRTTLADEMQEIILRT